MSKGNLTKSLLVVGLLFWASVSAFGQGTAFTYQGKLDDNGSPASGQYDFQFKLFDTATVGTDTQFGSMVAVSNVTVAAGIFTVQLDFGPCASCFNGAARFLEIAVKPTSGSTFTTLSPRQPVSATPYAIKSQTADGLSVACVNCITSSQIGSVNGSAVSGTIPVASVPAGSANYIQNTSSPQASSNFNISGNGTAGGTLSAIFVNAGQFNLGGQRVLGAPGQSNLFVGISAGPNTPSGSANAFFGAFAGNANTAGGADSFFGAFAGSANISGSNNAFFGAFAGQSNTTGINNTFFGYNVGTNNQSGSHNTFIGEAANFNQGPVTGDNNTLLGASSSVHIVGTTSVSNATAIGYRAQAFQDNSLILGGINGVNNATADTSVGIGTTTPGALLDVQRDQDPSTIPETARFTTYGANNEILSRASGGTRAAPTATPANRVLLLLGATGHDDTDFATTPRASILMTAAENWTASAQGTLMRFNTTTSGTTSTSTRMFIADDGNIGIGTITPNDKLEVNGIIRVATLGAAGSTALCRNASNQIATCSSSLRYKTDIAPFTGGLDLVQRLRPIRFTWKQGGARDLGFGAEEVAAVEPLFTFTNDKGEIEGVKYDRISVVLVNAIKEQQAQIEQQQARIKTQGTLIEQQQTIAQRQEAQLAEQRAAIARQQAEIDGLKRLVCAGHPRAAACKRRH